MIGRAASSVSRLVDFPDQLLALFLVGLHRLLLVHFFELGVAIVRVVALRAAGIVLEEIGVRIVDARCPSDWPPTMKSLRAILGNQFAVSTTSSSPSI